MSKIYEKGSPIEGTEDCAGPWEPAPGYDDLYGPLACEVHGVECLSAMVQESKVDAAKESAWTPGTPPHIDVVFTGPPGPDAPRFVEVEVDGASVNIGEWLQRPDGLWVLRIPLAVATGPL